MIRFLPLSKVIENTYSDKLNNLATDNFYDRLGMENMGYLPLERIKKRRIIPTEQDYLYRSQLLQGYVHDMGAAMLSGVGGHAGVFSNANDLWPGMNNISSYPLFVDTTSSDYSLLIHYLSKFSNSVPLRKIFFKST